MKSTKVSIGDNILATQYNNLIDDAKAASFLLPHAQSTPDMTLKVEAGVCYINGTRVIYAGGNSPTFTAPVSNNRIDLLCIDNAGTLSVVQGTAGASPAVPTYPTDKLVLCEVYLRSAGVHIDDVDDTVNDYIKQDVRAFIGSDKNFGAVAENIIPDTDNSRALGTSAKQWSELRTKKIYQDNVPIALTKFGGTGADGDLIVSSGTTNIDCGGAQIFTKNYTNISITGTGKVTFSNPHAKGTYIRLLVQNNVTLTSSATAPILDASGMGATGTNIATEAMDEVDHNGGTSSAGSQPSGGGAGGGGAGGSAGVALSATYTPWYMTASIRLYRKLYLLMCGSAGKDGSDGAEGGGGTGTKGTGGVGGRGGAILVIECGGSWNFTVANGISVAGKAGANGTNATSGAYTASGGGGGGAGGSGGMFLALYNSLTANSGTVNYSGGNGGNGGNGANGGVSQGGTNSGLGGRGGGGAGGAGGGIGGVGGVGGGGGSGGGGGGYNAVAPNGGVGGAGGAGTGTYGGTAGSVGGAGTGYGAVSNQYSAAGGGGGGAGAGGAEGSSVINQNIWFA